MRGPLRLVIAALCGAALALVAQRQLRERGSAQPLPAAQILAVVDGRPITVGDFAAEMERRGGVGVFPTADARRGLLDDMVRVEVLAANGRARGYLEDYGVRRDLLHVLAGRYQQEEIDPQLAALGVSEDEVAAFYADHRQRFTIPAAARAAVIHFALRRNAPDAVAAQIRARAAAVRAEAEGQQGATLFGALAVEYSDDQASRYQGGDTGWLAAGQADNRFDPAVVEAIFALDAVGQLAPLVETADGLYLIRLVEKKPASLRPLEEVAPAIRAQLLAEKRQQRTQALYAAAAGRVQIEVHADRLPAAPASASPGARPTGPPALPQL